MKYADQVTSSRETIVKSNILFCAEFLQSQIQYFVKSIKKNIERIYNMHLHQLLLF